jgi:hypothetical protein
MHNTSRCAEIEKRFPGLVGAIVRAHKIQSEEKLRSGTAGKRKSAGRNASRTLMPDQASP